MVVESTEERIGLLKAGMDGNEIERLYIQLNNIKIISLKEHNHQKQTQRKIPPNLFDAALLV